MSDVKSLKFNPSVTCSGLTLPQILSRQKLMQRARTQWSRFQVKRSSVHCGDESGNIAYNRSCSRTGIIPLQSFHNNEEGPYSLKVEIGYCNLWLIICIFVSLSQFNDIEKKTAFKPKPGWKAWGGKSCSTSLSLLFGPYCSGLFWVLLSHFGSFWVLLDPSRPFWVLLGPSGSFWVLLGCSRSFWVLLGPLGSFWVLLGPSGSFWVLLVPSLSFWVLLGPSWSFWVFLGPSGSFGPSWSILVLLGPSDLLGPLQSFWVILELKSTYCELMAV